MEEEPLQTDEVHEEQVVEEYSDFVKQAIIDFNLMNNMD